MDYNEKLDNKYQVTDDGKSFNIEEYINNIYKFNKHLAFDYVIGMRDKEFNDRIIDRRFDNE